MIISLHGLVFVTRVGVLQDVEQFCREKEELEKDRLRMHAENDSLQNRLEEMERKQEHNFIQGTMRLKKEYEQKMEELTKRLQILLHPPCA